MHALGEMETWHNFLQSMSGRGRGGSSASFLSSSRAAVPEQQNQLVELPVSLCQHQCCPLPLSKVPATHPSQLPHRVYTSADFACEQPWPREVSEVSNSDLPVTPTRSPKSHHSLLASHAVQRKGRWRENREHIKVTPLHAVIITPVLLRSMLSYQQCCLIS